MLLKLKTFYKSSWFQWSTVGSSKNQSTLTTTPPPTTTTPTTTKTVFSLILKTGNGIARDTALNPTPPLPIAYFRFKLFWSKKQKGLSIQIICDTYEVGGWRVWQNITSFCFVKHCFNAFRIKSCLIARLDFKTLFVSISLQSFRYFRIKKKF